MTPENEAFVQMLLNAALSQSRILFLAIFIASDLTAETLSIVGGRG
jgi:hypothetical protein